MEWSSSFVSSEIYSKSRPFQNMPQPRRPRTHLEFIHETRRRVSSFIRVVVVVVVVVGGAPRDTQFSPNCVWFSARVFLGKFLGFIRGFSRRGARALSSFFTLTNYYNFTYPTTR